MLFICYIIRYRLIFAFLVKIRIFLMNLWLPKTHGITIHIIIIEKKFIAAIPINIGNKIIGRTASNDICLTPANKRNRFRKVINILKWFLLLSLQFLVYCSVLKLHRKYLRFMIGLIDTTHHRILHRYSPILNDQN